MRTDAQQRCFSKREEIQAASFVVYFPAQHYVRGHLSVTANCYFLEATCRVVTISACRDLRLRRLPSRPGRRGDGSSFSPHSLAGRDGNRFLRTDGFAQRAPRTPAARRSIRRRHARQKRKTPLLSSSPSPETVIVPPCTHTRLRGAARNSGSCACCDSIRTKTPVLKNWLSFSATSSPQEEASAEKKKRIHSEKPDPENTEAISPSIIVQEAHGM